MMKVSKLKFILVLAVLNLIFTGCDRPDGAGNNSRLLIQIPSNLKLLKEKSIDKKAMGILSVTPLECFAISMSGPGIATNSRACGPQTGIVSGFVPSGGTMSMVVPVGNNRTVSVFMYLAPPGVSTCPDWNSEFEGKKGLPFNNTYKLKEVSGITLAKPEETITVDIGSPASLDDNILNQMGLTEICSPKLSGFLTSTGIITDLNGNEIVANLDSPLISSFSLVSAGDYSLKSFLTLSLTGTIYYSEGSANLPPYLKSIIRDPLNNLSVVGMREDGGLEEVALATGFSIPFDENNCPFSACSVPPWFRSITLSPDGKLYGLDHSGNFYLMKGAEPQIVTGYSIPTYVEQVVF